MARNRKNDPGGLLFGPALKATLICLFIVVSCVGYVWQKKQISELSQQIRSEENYRDDLRDKNKKMTEQYKCLLLPVSLEARAKELNLGLVPPDPARIWRLPEPAVDATVPVRATQSAGGKTLIAQLPR